MKSHPPALLSTAVSSIDIRFIPESEMRRPALGDWWHEGSVLHIRATSEGGQQAAFLVALHELVEAWLCDAHGVAEADVDAFDDAFTGDDEPGDDPKAPYRAEHRAAMLVEHLMALFLGITDYGTIR